MNKVLFLLFAVFSTGLLTSCYDENNTYGKELTDTKFRNIIIDTSTVTVTSVLIDSLETSGKYVALAGKYFHPIWGKVSASAYIPYSRPSYGTDISETVVLDSLILSLSYNGYYLGDTTVAQKFTIHKLKEKVVLNDNGYLYNKNAFAYDPEPLGIGSFRPRPHRGERLEIRLDDSFAKDMLTRLHNKDDQVSAERFEDYFKGIVIVPDESVSQSILSFNVADTLSNLVLNYHIAGETDNNLTVSFSPNTSTNFNHIDHDRSGTLMEPYPSRKVEIPSAELGDRGLLFGGIGWFSRLEFPFLNNLMEQGELVRIESAYLKIYPELGTYTDYSALPDSIYLYIADENNIVTDAVKDYLGDQLQGGVLVKDNTFADQTYYYFDVSEFMQEELGASGKYKHNLQLVLSSNDYTNTFKNLTFNSQQGRSPIVLLLTYKIYESY